MLRFSQFKLGTCEALKFDLNSNRPSDSIQKGLADSNILDQSLKWHKIDRNFACFWPPFFGGVGEPPPAPPSNFWSGIIKFSHILTMWQSFRAIGRGTSENAWRKKETSAVKHKPVRNGGCGWPNNIACW